MIKKITKLYIALFILAGFLGFVPATIQTAYAAQCANEPKILTIEPWYHDLCKAGTNDVEVGSNPAEFAGQVAINLLSIALQLAGYLAVGFVIWGGIKYILAAGDPGKLSSAKTIIQNALIGLLLALSAVAILNLITSNI